MRYAKETGCRAKEVFLYLFDIVRGFGITGLSVSRGIVLAEVRIPRSDFLVPQKLEDKLYGSAISQWFLFESGKICEE